jgi:ketosteroid isomerase-like protein
LLLLVASLEIACASAPRAGADSVRATLEGFMSALNALDVDRIASYFADDVTAFVPLAQAARVEGKPALVEVFRAYCETTRKTTPSTNIVPEKLAMDLNGSIAIVSFEFTSPASVARRTFVFRYRQGRWLISHFHASNFAAPK